MSKIEKVKLKSGLTIYLYEEKRRKKTFVSLVTKFGGIHHDFTLQNKQYHIPSGVAHFLEHYLLEHSYYGSLMDLFGNMYLSANGITSISKTEYYFSGVVNIEKAIDILIKGIHTVKFTKEDIEETKKAIYEEIKIGKDHKGRRMFEMQNESLFQTIPYKNTIGTEEDVKKIDIEVASLCHQAFYRPENECIFIGGNIEKEKIIKQIENTYESLENPKQSFSLPIYREPLKVVRKQASIFMPVLDPIVQISYKIDISNYRPQEKLKLDFYLSYFLKMNFGRTSVLYQKLIKKKIITGSLEIDNMFVENIGIITVQASTLDKQKFIEEVILQMENIVTEEELFEIYQKDSMLEIASRKENINAVLLPFMENIYTFSYEKEDTVRMIQKYTFTDFQKEINKINWKEYTVSIIKKQKEI